MNLDKIIENIEFMISISPSTPKYLVINENFLLKLSKLPGFWEKPQFMTYINPMAPVLNRFQSKHNLVLTVIPDTNELLFRLAV
jgi:hypothetical protein